MSLIPTFKSQFNRTYAYVTPGRDRGPHVWRPTNIPGLKGPDAEEIANIYTVAPIQHTQTDDNVHLFFSISAIPRNINEARLSFTTKSASYNLLKYAPYKGVYNPLSVSGIKAVAPVAANQIDADITLWFSIAELQDVETTRAKRRLNLSVMFPYNSRSVSTLTADLPLQVTTGGDQATVTFDITSLQEA